MEAAQNKSAGPETIRDPTTRTENRMNKATLSSTADDLREFANISGFFREIELPAVAAAVRYFQIPSIDGDERKIEDAHDIRIS